MVSVLDWVMIVLPTFLTVVSFAEWKKFRYSAYAFFVAGWGVVSMAQVLFITWVIK